MAKMGEEGCFITEGDDLGLTRLAKALKALQLEATKNFYELAEILVFARYHAKNDLDFIALIEAELRKAA